MKYLVIELQTNSDTVASLITQHNTIEEAESKYHTVLAAGAISKVPIHSAVLMNDRGTSIKSETYVHNGSE